jgi:hypothetical protein
MTWKSTYGCRICCGGGIGKLGLNCAISIRMFKMGDELWNLIFENFNRMDLKGKTYSLGSGFCGLFSSFG